MIKLVEVGFQYYFSVSLSHSLSLPLCYSGSLEFYHDVNKCHVVPRRHEYSYLMNKIMSMILPYGVASSASISFTALMTLLSDRRRRPSTNGDMPGLESLDLLEPGMHNPPCKICNCVSTF